MIVDRVSYLISLIEVFGAATALLLVFPLVMWHQYLKNKSYAFRFIFCVITQNALLINLVLLLGFLEICNVYTVAGCLAVVFLAIRWIYSDRQFFRRCRAAWEYALHILHGAKSLAGICLDARIRCGEFWKEVRRWPFWRHLAAHWLEYLVLGAAVAYNTWFLTYNVLTYHSVQFSDIPVHLSWVYGLDQGTLFVDGIYPFGMHAVVYCIHNFFFLDLREVLLYFGAFQTVLLLVCTYLLARRIFRWRYSALIALISFSLLLNQGRYAASLPQECGMFAVALMATCLFNFLHTPLEDYTVKRDSWFRRIFRINQYFTRRYMTMDALLFMLCVSLTIAYHFYTAIAAVILVLAILLAYISRTIRKKYLIPICLTGILGVCIAVGPLMACYARGIPFQESMQWAVSVISGEEWQGSESNYQSQLEAAKGETPDTPDETDTGESTAPVNTDKSLTGRIKFYYRAITDFSRVSLFGDDLTDILMICLGGGLCLAALLLPFRKTRLFGLDYASMILYTVFMCTMGAAQTLNLVEVVAASRASTFTQPFLGIIYALPMDFVFGLAAGWRNRFYRGFLSFASAAVCAGVVFVIFQQGWVHNFFDVNLAYYNESDYLINYIRTHYEKDMFTVVSTTDDYYQVVDYGYHENLSKFMDMVNGNQPEFKIPTPYVFVFIEKKVLQDFYYGSVYVNKDFASMDFKYFASTQDYYFQRAILESQAYYWALAFQKLYPNQIHVFYEDDIYIAYLIRQNPYYLYDFRIDYLQNE